MIYGRKGKVGKSFWNYEYVVVSNIFGMFTPTWENDPI